MTLLVKDLFCISKLLIVFWRLVQIKATSHRWICIYRDHVWNFRLVGTRGHIVALIIIVSFIVVAIIFQAHFNSNNVEIFLRRLIGRHADFPRAPVIVDAGLIILLFKFLRLVFIFSLSLPTDTPSLYRKRKYMLEKKVVKVAISSFRSDYLQQFVLEMIF